MIIISAILASLFLYSLDSSFITDRFNYIMGDNNNTNSGSGSGSNPGGGNLPGGGGPKPRIFGEGLLPRDDSDHSLNSSVSYNSEDIKQTSLAEITNVNNTISNPNLTSQQKLDAVLQEYNKKLQEVESLKREVKNLKLSESITVKLESENKNTYMC